MKRITLLIMSLLMAGSLCQFPAEAKTTRKTPARKTATTKRAKQSATPTVKTAINRLDKWSEQYSQTFTQKFDWAKEFVKNTVVPYIAGKYPAKVSLSDAEKCRILYSDIEKYVGSRDEYSMNTASMAAGSNLIANMGYVVTLTQMADIESCMADEASRRAWMEYAASVSGLLSSTVSLLGDYAVCVNGPGSFLMVEGPMTYDAVDGGLQAMLADYIGVLKAGRTYSASQTYENALGSFLSAISPSSLDPEMLEYIPEESLAEVKNAPSTMKPVVAGCVSLFDAWRATLPASQQANISNNLSRLLEAAVKSTTE